MKLINKLTDYIYDKSMSIHIYDNSVNVVNYSEISRFTSNNIVITYPKGKITITGNKLVVSKLISDELLISGEIKQIELG